MSLESSRASRYRPEVAPAQRGAVWRAAGHAPQGPGDLADLDLGRGARRGARLCRRPAQAGARARRRRGHHRRQPPAPLRHVCCGAEHRRHRGADLPGLGGRRDGLCPRPRRGEVRGGAEPGAGRQAHLHRRAHAAAANGRLRGGARARRLRPHPPSRLRARAGAGPARDARERRRRRLVARRDRQGPGLGRERDALHLRHHRPPQGRDADPRQHRASRPRTATSSTTSRPTTPCSPICPWPGWATTSSPTARPSRAPCAWPARRAPRPSSRTAGRSRPPTSSPRRASTRTCSPRSWCAWRMPGGSRRPCSTTS